jgi:hypothetical protein
MNFNKEKENSVVQKLNLLVQLYFFVGEAMKACTQILKLGSRKACIYSLGRGIIIVENKL